MNPRAFGLLLWSSLAACPSSAGDRLDRADDLERARQFSRAQIAYRDALRKLGDADGPAARELRTRALAHQADLCYLDLGDFKCAAEAYRRLIENYPEAPETFQARTHLAEMLRDRLGDLPGAIAQYKALANAYPGKPGSDDFQYQVAEGYFSLRDYSQARSEARALLDRFAGSARASQARFLLASCYELEAQAAGPTSAPAAVLRTEAAAAFEDLLSRDPDGELAPRARVALAKLLEQQGDKARALRLLAQGVPDPSEAAYVLEERRRLSRQLASERPVSREAIFREGHAAASPRRTHLPPAQGRDPFGDEGD